MTRWLRAVLGRWSPLTRRLTVMALGLLAIGVVASALTPGPRRENGAPPPSRTLTGIDRGRAAAPHSRPVSSEELARAREAAARFLAGYLPLVYGRGSARSVGGVTPDLRLRLLHSRTQVTPVERRRRPRVISLTVSAEAPGLVLAAALVEDDGIATYALRITLREARSSWLVSAVDSG